MRTGSLSFVVLLTFLASVGVLAAAPSGPAAGAERPNVVLVFFDDLGYRELGCTGNEHIETPVIDALRDRGVLFTQAYAASPVCAPSRASLLTGRHQGHAAIRDNLELPNRAADGSEMGAWQAPTEPGAWFGGQQPIPAGTETIARTLKRAGYATACVGKWGLGGPETEGVPWKQGFDLFVGYLCQRNAHNFYPTYLWRNDVQVPLPGNDRGLTGETYSADVMREAAVAFLENRGDDVPFFLYYATCVPHLALQAPEESIAPYREKFGAEAPYEGGRGYLPHPTPRAAYAAMVTRLDADLGRVVDALKARGEYDDTIFIVTSDNGATWDIGGYDPAFFRGNGDLRGHKTQCWEGGLRVPLIVSWANRTLAGAEIDDPVVGYDLYPTILSLTGTTDSLPADTTLDGVDLSRAAIGEGDVPERSHITWEFHAGGGWQAVRMDDWKGIRTKAHGAPEKPIELFDLATDPNETTDVAELHPDVAARIEAIMREDRSVSPIPRWNFAPAERGDRPRAAAPGAGTLPRRSVSPPAAPRTFEWTGNGDGTSLLDFGNWRVAQGEPLDAARWKANQFAPLLSGSMLDVDLGEGTMTAPQLDMGGATVRWRSGTLDGADAGFGDVTLVIESGEVRRRFLLGSNVRVAGDGVLVLGGGGNPVNVSTIELLGPNARVRFLDETVAAVTSEHLGKFMVDGKSARDSGGLRVVVEADGDGGCVVRPADS